MPSIRFSAGTRPLREPPSRPVPCFQCMVTMVTISSLSPNRNNPPRTTRGKQSTSPVLVEQAINRPMLPVATFPFLVLLVAGLRLSIASCAEPHDVLDTNNLVASCIVPLDAAKRGPDERTKMLANSSIRRAAQIPRIRSAWCPHVRIANELAVKRVELLAQPTRGR